MNTYVLNSEQFINKPIKEVFGFFARPENLKEVTPKNLSFNILTPSPIVMEKGTLIDYTIKPLGFPVRWTTIIVAYEPPHRFIDAQLKGPYSFWYHTHNFVEKEGGTLIKDEVRYLLPFGPFGKLAHWIYVKKELQHIFDFRKKVVLNYFDK